MQDPSIMSGKVELLIDGVHYYILVFTDCAVNPHLDFHIKEISK